MPSRKADDIPHAIATEHWIHKPGQKLSAPFATPVNQAVGVAPWSTDASSAERAFAEVSHAMSVADPARLKLAVSRLETELRKEMPAEYRVQLGKAWLALGDSMKASAFFRDVLASDTKNVEARRGLAECLTAENRINDASAELEQLLKNAPWHSQSDGLLMELLSAQRDGLKAKDLYERYVVHHPPNVDVLLLYADLRAKVGANDAEVQSLLTKAAAADGLRMEPWLAMSQRAAFAKNWGLARSHAEEALTRQPHAVSALTAAARAALGLGDINAARNWHRQAQSLDPNDPQVRSLSAAISRLAPLGR